MATTQTAPGIAITHETTGEGRPLVLVHGMTENRHAWDPLVAPLVESGFAVTTVDLRGHGESSRVPPYELATMAADLGAVLAELGDSGADEVVLVGHSLGGAVASAYAAGGRCRAVVNVDQPLRLAGFKEVLGEAEPLLRGTDEEFQTAITSIFDSMAGRLAGTERDRIDDLRQAEQDVVLGVWDTVLTATVEELDALVDGLLGAVTVPYLSLHGIDPGPDYESWLTSHLPQATVEVWPDLGHYPHLVEPARFATRIADFAKQ